MIIKQLMKLLLAVSFLALTTSFQSVPAGNAIDLTQEIVDSLKQIKPQIIPKIPLPDPLHWMDGSRYMYVLSQLESNDNYFIINRYGYMGRYQFGKRTLISIGYDTDMINNFLDSPPLQDYAMVTLTSRNRDYLKRKGITIYVGKSINGITITLEGLLAACHLVGPAAVSHYVLNDGDLNPFYVRINGKLRKIKKSDGNGTSLEYYIKQFDNKHTSYGRVDNSDDYANSIRGIYDISPV